MERDDGQRQHRDAIATERERGTDVPRAESGHPDRRQGSAPQGEPAWIIR
jgi:hypothetical protein